MAALAVRGVHGGERLRHAARRGNPSQPSVNLVGEHDGVVGTPARAKRQASRADFRGHAARDGHFPEGAARGPPGPESYPSAVWCEEGGGRLFGAGNWRRLRAIQAPDPKLLPFAMKTGEHELSAVRD